MNINWPIVGWLAISCNSQPSTVTHKESYKQDTAKASAIQPSAQNSAVHNTSSRSKTFTIDLNNDLLPDTITISSSYWDSTSFDTVHISIANYGCTTFSTDTSHPWTTVDDWFLDSNKNALPTKAFFVAKSKTQSVLLLFGDLSAAGYRDNFSIIDIEGNRPRVVLSQDERHLSIERPLRLQDIDNDGRLEFVYRQIFEYNGKPDTLNGKIGTYSPYFIYTVDSPCVLNRQLTVRYNEMHYVFAGFKYDESIEVFYPNDRSQARLWKQ